MKNSDFHIQINELQNQFNSGRTKDVSWRAQQLKQIKRLLQENEEELAEALKEDLGKSALESYITEINFLVLEVDHALKQLKKWMQPKQVETPIAAQPAKSYIQYEPLGTVLIMGAWNYPLQLTLGPLIPAIAAGNTAVIKAPRTAAATDEILAKLIPEYLDQEAILSVPKDFSNEQLLSRAWGKIFITGSGRVGKIIMEAAAKTLTPVTLELGGKSPAFFTSSVNMKTAVRRMIHGKFINAGQTCVAPDYILLDRSRKDEFYQTVAQTIREFYGEKPEKSKDYGRIINQRNFDGLVELIKNEQPFIGGDYNQDTLYIAPTVLKDVSLDHPVMQREIFGPILPVIEIDNLEQGITFVQINDKPLALYVFAEDKKQIDQILQRTTAGGVCVNEALQHLSVHELPFGGVGPSGIGKYHGHHGFLDFSNQKAVLYKKTGFDPSLRYPPYSKASEKKFKFLLNLHLPGFLNKSATLSWLIDKMGKWFLK